MSLARWWRPAAAVSAIAYLAAMAATGALPERRHHVRVEVAGVLAVEPEAIDRVTVDASGAATAYVKDGDTWRRDDGALIDHGDLSNHLALAVRFMRTANPVRVLGPADVANADPAGFGLEEPRLSVTLERRGEVVLEADFGGPSSDGLLQYMRLRGDDSIYMMSGFVAREWKAVAGH